jgi:hypothetical protein
MRWDNLFDDLEGQLEQELSAEDLDLRAEEERLRLGRLSIRDRLLAIHESQEGVYSLHVTLANGDVVAVRPLSFGRDWMSGELLDDSTRKSQFILPIPAIAGMALGRVQVAQSLAPRASEGSPASLSSRLTLSFVLRDLCRRRAAIELRTPLATFHGTIDRVGRDHLDLAVHELGQPRRDAAVLQSRLLPLSQVLLVRI